MDEDISRRKTNKQGDVLEDFVERNRRLGVGRREREKEREKATLITPTAGI
jgi:hypothetical protein